jgi:inorganic pyrophosphatase
MTPFSRMPAFDEDTGDLLVVIETPKGSRNKYGYEEELGAFKLNAVMPEGTSFPFDFGFVPSTVGEDGDPLDVLVLLDASVFPGCVLTARLVGVIEAEQRESDGKWVRNDRLVAAALKAHTNDHIHSLDDLRPGLIQEIEGFFEHYNRLRDKVFRPLGRNGPEQARKLVEQGMAAHTRKGR